MKVIPGFSDSIMFGGGQSCKFVKGVEADYPEGIINSLKDAKDRFGNLAYPMKISIRVKEPDKSKIK